MRARWFQPKSAAVVALLVGALLAGCSTPADHPPGVPASISFHVQPVYPRSFDLIASAGRKVSTQTLEDAWRRKAVHLAAGRKFQMSQGSAHATEEMSSINTGYVRVPIFSQSRSVRGTVRLLE